MYLGEEEKSHQDLLLLGQQFMSLRHADKAIL